MNEELNEILKFYEEERQSLESLINDHIKNGEYKQAHQHQKALFKVNQSFSLLRKLENPNYEEIEQLEYLLHNYSKSEYEKLVQDNRKMKDYFEAKKNYLEQKIKSLKEKSVPFQIDGQEFDDVIYKLIEGKIQRFQFFLNLENHLYLDFKRSTDSIIITIPKYKKLKKEYILSKSNRKVLKGLGFELSSDEKSLIYNYKLDYFKNSIEIKTLTSRIIYDGFGYSNIKNSSLIVIVD
ncbi:hypothetical protein EZ428_04855 [Pedobacter frigiditerrae]|uniref:Uncharacterized protein n=1 Tax=Pedobacter frigiditerrae TaxID=2530452 RepID=A0A4R0N2W4_9SPHI|nr:hypothetical protein [Pedobacter frigiditerrae]TCC94110.1 hypothetical protein EZ428_04855 [Pedobacter frigiditerrae]